MRRCLKPVLMLLALLLPGFSGRDAAADTPPESLAAFRSEIMAAQAAAGACGHDRARCKDAHIPPTAQVEGAHGVFTMRWTFFGDALERAATASDIDREWSMEALKQQLWTTLSEAAGSIAAPAPDLASGRREANRILARPEFQGEDGPGWMERHFARIQEAVLRLFSGMDRLGKRAPWIAPLLEWTCFALAAAGLLWYVRQSLRRQSLLLQLEAGERATVVRGLDAEGWQRQAADHAAAGQWREAVHALFWAAIALLEARRAWRPNPTRTPREYARLVRPGSELQAALRELLGLMETSWYGTARASEGDFARAEVCLRAVADDRGAPARSQAAGSAA